MEQERDARTRGLVILTLRTESNANYMECRIKVEGLGIM